ncbi:hypothetical protein BGZ63DRAFT_368522 [Mariannaea sp. PMI_226]|nr:hypothetical protein BGZ63DRAFT_368522 [Mariannaea sp. PMI_226]
MVDDNTTPLVKRDRSGENFQKRWRTLQKTGFDIHEIYHADVYILLQRKGQNYVFKSTDKAWPPPPAELERSFPLPVQVTAADIRLKRQGISHQ